MRFRMSAAGMPHIHTARYDTFSGVDFSCDPSLCAPSRSPDGVNMYADTSGRLRKRPGWRRLVTVASPVRGIHAFRDGFILHGGDRVYSWSGGSDTPRELMRDLTGDASHAFIYRDALYLMTGAEFIRISDKYLPKVEYGYDSSAGKVSKTETLVEGENVSVKRYLYNPVSSVKAFQLKSTAKYTQELIAEEVKSCGYTPLTYIGCRMESDAGVNNSNISFSGEPYEESSMATHFRRNSFEITSDGTAEEFPVVDRLIAADAKLSDLELVTAQGNLIRDVLYFCYAGEKSETLYTGGSPNGNEKWRRYLYLDMPRLFEIMRDIGDTSLTLNIRYPAEPAQMHLRVEKCRFSAEFCHRRFISGNPEYPNADWYSEPEEPTYFREINYTEIGDAQGICGYLPVGSELGVVKRGNRGTALYLRRSEWSESGYFFPLSAAATGIGAVSENAVCVFCDDALYLSDMGVMGIVSQNITGERVLAPRSTRINLRLCREKTTEAVLGVWNGYLLCCTGGNVYLADSRARSYARNSSGAFEYEWYFWSGVPALCLEAAAGVLYFGTADGGICRMSDDLTGSAGYTDYPNGIGGSGTPVSALWSTRFDDDGDFTRKKTMPRRGSGVLLDAVGQAEILLRTDRELERQVLARSRGIYDTPRPAALQGRVKKYGVIQVVCASDTPTELAILGITRRFVIGRYVK